MGLNAKSKILEIVAVAEHRNRATHKQKKAQAPMRLGFQFNQDVRRSPGGDQNMSWTWPRTRNWPPWLFTSVWKPWLRAPVFELNA